MESVTNGRPKEMSAKKDTRPNGHAVGFTSSSTQPTRPSFGSKGLSLFARVLVWYFIYTALFRCPSSTQNLTEGSSKVCKPYLVARDAVAPYVQPYYQQYAAAQVEKARPYYDRFHSRVYTPSVELGRQTYERYGASRVDQAWSYSNEQWSRLIKPQIDAAQTQVQDQYSSNVAPHVTKASEAAAPYYSAGKDSVVNAYDKHISPAYDTVLPYSQRTYSTVRNVLVNDAVPLLQSGWRSSAYFLKRIVWPRIRILYGENVEPQLLRIVERLGSYREGQKIKSAVAEMENSASSVSSSLSSITSSASSMYASTSTTTASSTVTASISQSEQQQENARERIENDLQNWQKKFAKAADTGAEDLRDRVKEITDRQIKQLNGVGEALVIELEESSRSEQFALQKTILSTVKSLGEDPSEEAVVTAEDKVVTASRKAGLAVKSKWQDLRTWKATFEAETSSLILTATNSTLEVIDNIRDLGLQEIGMRWAWMEGVTYKDWSKYHEVKKSFDQWRKQVLDVAQKHPGFENVKSGADQLEDKGTSVAEEAAKELSRLKEVGSWKVRVNDRSDDFSTNVIPADAAAAGRKVISKVKSASEKVLGTSQGSVESATSEASEWIAEVASDASTKLRGKETGTFEGIASSIVKTAGDVSESISEAVAGTPQPKVESIYSAAKEKGENFASDASEVLVGTPEAPYQSVATEASSSLGSLASAVSEAVGGSQTPATESLHSAADAASSSLSSAASKASQKVYGGVMAQEVRAQQPILDDVIDDDASGDATFTDKPQNLASAAGDKLAELTRAVDEALKGATSTQGTVESASSAASEQYSKALLAASSVLYGTEQGAVESATSVAADKWADAVAAASSVIYGTPTPASDAVPRAVSSAYSEATERAREHYSHAMSIVSAQISGTKKPVHEQMFASVSSAYSEALSAAKGHLDEGLNGAYGTKQSPMESMRADADKKYSDAVAAASSQLDVAKSAVGATSKPGYEKSISEASERFSSIIGAAREQRDSATKAASEVIFGTSQGILASVTSIASAKLADSLREASAQYASIKAAAGATPTPVYQKYIQDGQRRYYEAVGLAHERYSEFVSSASEAAYGTPRPAYEKVLDAAQSQFKMASAQASEKLNSALTAAKSAVDDKKPKSQAQNVLSLASAQYSSALSIAAASLSSVTAAASTGVYGTSTGKLENLASDASAAIIGTETPWTESAASQAVENWQALVSKASEQVYGAPTPFSESIVSQAGEYASQATDVAASKYQEIQSIFSELIQGKEPDFTASVMSRLSSAYYTGAHVKVAASASTYASEAYASASSVISSVFTPPATLEAIIAAAQEQVNAAVDAASVQYYGTTKGTYEKATSAAASAASSVSSVASEAVYGTPKQDYVTSAQTALNDIALSASNAIVAAIYGSTATGVTASISSAADKAYVSVSSAVSENVSKASSIADVTNEKIKEAIYGPEQGAVESAQSRLLAAVEIAKARLAEMGGDALEGVKEQLDGVGSSVSSIAAQASKKARDEL